jgi:hypothetical protein
MPPTAVWESNIDAVVCSKLFGCARCPPTCEILGTRDEDKRHFAERLRYLTLLALFSPIDSDVETLPGKAAATVV